MNVYNPGKSKLDELDIIAKSMLLREGFCGRQSQDKRLYSKRWQRIEKFQRGFMIKQKLKTACYMATAINEWIILQ